MALWNAVDEKIRKSDVDGANSLLENLLATEKSDRFAGLIGAKFTNPPGQVLAYINRFVRECEQAYRPKAIYLEMNGFDINYDLWFFSLFGYNRYEPDPDDLDWLSDWQSEGSEQVMPVTGLESVQADFAWYCEQKAGEDNSYSRVHELATLLVMVKFVALVRDALASGALAKPVPVIATAHEFDIAGRFLPPTFLQKMMQAFGVRG